MVRTKAAAAAAALLMSFAAPQLASAQLQSPQQRPAQAPKPTTTAQQIPRPPGAVAGGQQAQPAAPAARPGTSARTAPPSIRQAPNIRPAESGGFDASQRGLVDRASTYLTGLRNLVGEFVQVGPDGKRVHGQFYLQKPGRMRFEYDAPTTIELIADGQSVAIRDRKLATQDLYMISQTPLRFLLADRLDLMRDTTVVAVHADDVFVTVVIEEKHLLAGTHRLMLMFSAKDFELKQWTITDPQGFDTTVAVYNLDTRKVPDPSLFRINYERDIQ